MSTISKEAKNGNARYAREWRSKNIDHYREYQREYQRKRRAAKRAEQKLDGEQ